MTKVIPVALQSHYDGGANTVAICMKVTRADAVTAGWTDHDQAITVSGVTYIPTLDVTNLRSSEGLSVDNMELRFLDDEADLPLDELQKGFWDGAAFEIFAVNWKSPTDGIDVLKRGIMGEGRFEQGQHTLEMRSLAQLAQQTQGAITSKTCRARLGDAACTRDLTSFTFTSTITGIIDPQRHFTDTARTEDDGYFTDGYVAMATGECAGQRRKVKLYETGDILLAHPFIGDLAIGDEYTIVAGCDRTLATCIAKFDNVLNFQGMPHLPGQDDITSASTSDTEQPVAYPDVGTDTPEFPGG